MKKPKVMALFVASVLTLSALTGCGSSEKGEEVQNTNGSETVQNSGQNEESTAQETSDDNIGTPFEKTVNMSLMNSKPEITEALEAGAEIFGNKYNVKIEIYETDNPGDMISQKYAAGDAPTLAIVDAAQVKELAGEKIADLSSEAWCEVGGSDMGYKVDGKVYGMPLTVEGMCILYNKTAVEDLLGEEFVPEDYETIDAFASLIDGLKAAGMETPVILNSEDWSIGQKSYQFIYDYQDGTADGAISFLKDVHDGKTTFEDNEIFNEVYDVFDLFVENNINKDDPLAADYDLNASYLAEGDAAFWLNGTWAWPDFEPYAVEGTEYGILPFPVNDSKAKGTVVADSTKYITVDTVNSDEEQQKAAKMFMDWLVFDAEGQDVLINQCGIVTAFTNIELPPTNPFNQGLKDYIEAGKTCEGANYMPSDHRSVLAPHMQAYIDGKMTRQEIAEKLDEYWRENLPVE